eukprot:CAMPEP_0170377026 /NCGR_PEP_ID=MMETSP0117_2-20130122/12047_1 /TAXON_ID=400756 /ORGANISM="Durinskia baltica, Strain CSIRO CS-38" /LENGTH=545 /DNA_ID=CAMNT_0010632285 /DNA_START=123 /DNA_END=1760 /DNA_ORIENTATION=-
MKRSPSTSSETNDFMDEGGKKVYQVSKSRLVSLIDWVTVIRRYVPILWYALLTVLMGQIVAVLFAHRLDFKELLVNDMTIVEVERKEALGFALKAIAVTIILLWYLSTKEKTVFLLDFSTFEPPEEWKCTSEQIMEMLRAQGCFTEESLKFQERMLAQSGVGPATAWPPGITQCLKGELRDSSTEAARQESEVVIYDCVARVLGQTGIDPKMIDILVVNCSLFSPTPSLCSMVINRFKMRSDVSSYNLSGMGCSAGIISVELVKNMLAAQPNSTALIVSTENLTQSLYMGNDRGFLLQNILFRVGGAAMILSNKWTDAFRARFKLLHVVRTQYISEESVGCVYETQDSSQERGVRLSKDIVKVAGRALEKNFTTLGPHVLPLSEQLKTGFSMILRLLAKKISSICGVEVPKIAPYIPDFKRGLDHFCIHAGGRGVIDGIEKNLNLTPRHVEASRQTLFRYGNTSSSSIWYEMDFIRKHCELRRGQRVMQVAFGSGFKCNSAVWLCLNNPPVKVVDSADLAKIGCWTLSSDCEHSKTSEDEPKKDR